MNALTAIVRYGCTYCDRTFTTSEGRDQHENAKHAASWSTFYPPSYQLRDPVTSWEFTPAPSGDHSDAPLAEDSDVSDDNSDVLSDDHRESQQTLLAVEREVDKELSSSGLTPSPPTSPPGYEDELVEVVIALQSCSVRPEYGSILCDMDTLEHHVTGAVEQQPHIAGSPSLGLEHTITSQTHDTYSAQQASCSMQAELYSHSSVPSGATLPDLTKLITKAGDYAVARGGFGDIWKCIYQTDQGPIDVAVKSLLVYTSDQLSENMEKKFERLRRELTTCARLDHKNILPVFGYTHGFGLLMAIVYPWAKNGNLTTYLEHEDAALTVFRRFKILADVTAGLQYIHANNIIHGDLTGPNVLIHADGTACLADFGLSLVYSEVITKSAAPWTSAFHGNLRWLAPELLGHSDDDLPVRPSKHSDVYSFGGIMLQVLTSKIPYHYLGEASVILRIGSGVKPSRSRYPMFSDEYWHFIEECWSTEPLDRPSSERLVEVIMDELNSLSSSSTSL
ncbi:kinase-like protein [Rhizopogon vinicolor AM-OR11-026]|uniref:Kinase-like protein n=1 Tax=Rhizopogon vinicolor AM-OR11-026 TaxID=1314800 RepID=A0A1B7MS24_9AGAM|nr:kinase-like protein [Rhizopogon vinicolor AM-OR11-026]